MPDRPKPNRLLSALRRHDSALWRRAARAGAVYGPTPFVRYSPTAIGIAFAALLPNHRRAVIRNLRAACGQRTVWREAIDVGRLFASYAHSMAEAFVVDGSRRKDAVIAHVVDDQHYAAAVKKGRGVILATAHTGGWQAAGAVLRAVHRERIMVVMQPERDQRAQAIQDDARDDAGVQAVHVGTDPLDVLPLLSHLRHQGVLAVQMDRVPDGMRARTVEFLGETRAIPEGPLLLAALSGAPIVTTLTRRLGYLSYEFVSIEPVELPRRPTSEQLDEAAQSIANAIEAYVRKYPTQWYHFVA